MPQLDDIATIVYTSGTGKPKGVLQLRTMIVITSGMEEIWGFLAVSVCCRICLCTRCRTMLPLKPCRYILVFMFFFSEGLETFQKTPQTRTTNYFLCTSFVTKLHLGVNEKMPPSKQKWLFKIPILNKIVKRKFNSVGMNHVRVWLNRF